MVCNPIAAARTAKGLSREDLGRLLGVSTRTVSYWETWKKSPGPRREDDLRRVLGLTESDLWRVRHRRSPLPVGNPHVRRTAIW